MLLSLLLDDEDGTNNRNIWNVYYHLHLNTSSLQLVQSQAKKLHLLSASMQSWHDSKYGKSIRLCAQQTLNELRNIWKAYDTSDLSGQEQISYDQSFKRGIEKAVYLRGQVLGHSQVLTGCRSAAPTTLQSVKELPKLYQHFWDHGITHTDHECLSQARHSNPMFASLLTDTLILHYGTDPLLGFHLATAYVPLLPGSPLRVRQSEKSKLHKVVESARLEFQAWGESFRKCAGLNLTVRFISGDALAFCFTLRHLSARGESSARWYCRQYSLEPLELDSQDYATEGNAPLTFNVIDTSNLTDHLGAINLLVAASPLLDDSLSATLKMETIVRQERDHQALLDNLLGGHFVTMSILFGLFPVEYWTGATANSTAEEAFLDLASGGGSTKSRGQMYNKITWKRPISAPIGMPRTASPHPAQFDEADLAALLYGVYLKMFQHENIGRMYSKLDVVMLQSGSRPPDHRGTLAALLLFVKQREVVSNWDKFMDAFLSHIENDQNLLLGMSYIQELYIQLHLLDVYTVPILRQPCKVGKSASGWNSINAWEHIPAAVCVTLKVPRTKIKAFTDLPSKAFLTPPVRCHLQSSRSLGSSWQNIFVAIQLSFGNVTTSGSRDDSNFSIDVLEDKNGWKGNSSMIVSFYAPSWVILLEAQATIIAFGVQCTPQSMLTFSKVLGPEMNVYETTLGDQDHVFITRNRPNLKGYASMGSSPDIGKKFSDSSNQLVRSTVTAKFNRETGQISTLTGRLDIIADDIKSALGSGAQVETVEISPCVIAVIIGKMKEQRLHFPAPVYQACLKCRIARKSSYLEVEAPLSRPLGDDSLSHFISPTYPNGLDPSVWNMPRLNLDRLPKIDTTQTKDVKWLTTHLSLMWSSRERQLREKSMSHGTVKPDVRVNFKDSLFSSFMHYTGLQGQRSKVFGIDNPKNGGVQIIFIVSCLRLNLSDHTVVLDAALLPLTHQILPMIGTFLEALKQIGLCAIHADEDELKLWKEMLPAFVERCRQWKHRPTCEYNKDSQIPLSLKTGEKIICSCGNGIFPKNFITDIPHWATISKHLVRAAISPIFTPPFVEPLHEPFDLDKLKETISGNACGTCGKKETSANGSKLQTCARCHIAKYCSVACQRAAWKSHKKHCAKEK